MEIKKIQSPSNLFLSQRSPKTSNLCSVMKQNNPSIPEDIIKDIVLKLPAKSIGRCRCVSKLWRSLFTNPDFIKSHLDRIKKLQQPSLILFFYGFESLCSLTLRYSNMYGKITESEVVSLVDYRYRSWYKVVASCDGLLLVKDKYDYMFLINAVTRDIKQVPSFSYLDNGTPFILYGLGYDSVNDDYKIVGISYSYNIIAYVTIYSVRNGTWKNFEENPVHVVGDDRYGVYFEGSIYWFATNHDTNSPVILSFDLAKEKFYETSLPSSFKYSDEYFVRGNVCELGGRLCVSTSNGDNEIEVWVMNEYGNNNSWTKLIVIYSEGFEFRPLCMLGEQQMVLLNNKDQLVKYDMKKGSFEDIVDGIPDHGWSVGKFIETLVSPHYWRLSLARPEEVYGKNKTDSDGYIHFGSYGPVRIDFNHENKQLQADEDAKICLKE